MNKLMIFVVLLFSLNLISSELIIGNRGTEGVNFRDDTISSTTSTNYSEVNVNDSIFWQGHTGTDGSWLTGIAYNFNQSLPFNDWLSTFLYNYNQTYSGSTYNATYNTWAYNQSSTSSSASLNYYPTGLSEGKNYNAGKGFYAQSGIIDSIKGIGSPYLATGIIQNQLLQSEVINLNTAWIKINISTVIADKVISPRNTLVAENISCNFTIGYIRQFTNNASIGNWTFSIYAKSLNNGSVFGLKVNTSAEDTNVTNFTVGTNWERFRVTSPLYNAHTNKTVEIVIYGNISKNISLWGAQLNIGEVPYPYYTTTTTLMAEQAYFYSVPAIVSAGGFSGTTGTFSGAVTATTGGFSGIITNTIQALFISQDGIVTTATTASTVSAPIQRSPRIRLSGTVWDIGGAGSRTTNFIIENLPIVNNKGKNSSASLNFEYGYNDVTDLGMYPLMSLGSNGTLDVFGTNRGIQVLNNSNFTGNFSWQYNSGWRLNETANAMRYEFSLGATGNLTQNTTFFNTTIKPNRWYELTYFIPRANVAGCLAFIPTDFADKNTYLPGISITTGGVLYDVEFKTNSNPKNFTITAMCTAGRFYLDSLQLKEINSGDIIANGMFTGGGLNGIKIDESGNVNITAGNLTLNGGNNTLSMPNLKKIDGVTPCANGDTLKWETGGRIYCAL
jgi:hypothetical protein